MSARIRTLNDQARQAMGVLCRVVQTSGICALDPFTQSAIRELVEKFDCFTPDNDPHGEHDFGAFDYAGERIFWKFDYYDSQFKYGSEDPANPAITRRLLTIMLAKEY
jgi:Protein of unknown function (DUF3768)